MHNSKNNTDVVTRKHMNVNYTFVCDSGPIFQVANLNRYLTQFRPSENHYLRDLAA